MKTLSPTLRPWLFGLMFLLILIVVSRSVLYLSPEIFGILNNKSVAALDSGFYRSLFFIHVVFGITALVTGIFGFFGSIRNKRIALHRNMGKVYVIACLTSGLAGLYTAWFADGGIVASLGFFSLAVLWLYFTIRAYINIKQKNIAAHQRWMIRSYALTFSAVTLRLGLLLALLGLVPFMKIYVIMSWASWLINLSVVEFFLRE